MKILITGACAVSARSVLRSLKMSKFFKDAEFIGWDMCNLLYGVYAGAFDELGLHRLDCVWFDDNIASKALHTKCGWRVEGVRRECVYKGGKFIDVTYAGILDSEYYALVKNNNYWNS